jgi:hypothetical protein
LYVALNWGNVIPHLVIILPKFIGLTGIKEATILLID